MLTCFTSNLDSVKLSPQQIAWLKFYWLKHCLTSELLSVVDLPYTLYASMFYVSVNSNVFYISPSFLAIHIPLIFVMFARQHLKIEICTLFQPVKLQIICILTIIRLQDFSLFKAWFARPGLQYHIEHRIQKYLGIFQLVCVSRMSKCWAQVFKNKIVQRTLNEARPI